MGAVTPAVAASPDLPHSSCGSGQPVGNTPQLVPSICVTNTVLCVSGSNCGGTPTSTNVHLWVNATGNKVVRTRPPWVQVVFVVETTVYDGVYNATNGDNGYGINGKDPCAGPCRESDGAPFFVHNVGRIAQGITMKNAGVASSNSVTFGLVDYSTNNDSQVAGSDDHDDGYGDYYNVDVSTFEPAAAFNNSVRTEASSGTLFGGNWVPVKSILSHSNFSSNFLDSPMITAIYEAAHGIGLGWNSNSSTYHVIVWIGSTLPKDPNYQGDYCVTYNNYAEACPDPTPTVEPAYDSEPTGETMSAITSLAKSEGTVIDAIDLPDGMTELGSGDYVTGSATQMTAAQADVTSILSAGCYLAQQTGGTWEGPTPASTGVGYTCSAAATNTSAGNLTDKFRTPTDGNYTWGDNPSLAWALTNIAFPVLSESSNVAAYGTKSNAFTFIPFVVGSNEGISLATGTGMVFSCVSNATDITQACMSSWKAAVVGGESWGWPNTEMWLNDSWSVSFNVTAGAYFPASYLNELIPVDVCIAYSGCLGTGVTGLGASVFSQVNYGNYQQNKMIQSFPPAFVTVEAPPFPPLTSVIVSPTSASVITNATTAPFSATPVCAGTCPTGTTYTWNLTNNALGTLIYWSSVSVEFEAGSIAGNVTLFVNATLNNVTKSNSTVISIVQGLTSVSVSPQSVTVVLGDLPNIPSFTAAPSCKDNVCPPGVSYSWSLSHSYLGRLNASTGQTVIFDDAGWNGLEAVFVNATLGGRTVQSQPAMITLEWAPIHEVIVSPSSVALPTDGSYNFTAYPGCGTLMCPPWGTYSWSLTSDLCSLNATSGQTVRVTAGGITGNTTLLVKATINSTTIRSSPVPITVVSTSPSPLASVSINPPTATVEPSGSLTFTATVICVGGTCPLGATYSWSLTSILGHLNSSSGPVVNLTAGLNLGTVALFVNATLENVTKMSAPIIITIAIGSTPTIYSFTASPSRVDLNSWTIFTTNASGGVGALSFSYFGLPPGDCPSANFSVLACRPNAAGIYGVTVTVTDQAGHSAARGLMLTVVPVTVGPAINSFVVNPATVTVGSPTTFDINVSGGVGTIIYRYTGLPPGCSFQNVASASCIPTAAGTYTIRAFVNDSDGNSVNTTVQLTVTASTSTASILESPFLLDGLLAALVVVVVILMFTVGRKKQVEQTIVPPPPSGILDEVKPVSPPPPHLPPAGDAPPDAKDAEAPKVQT